METQPQDHPAPSVPTDLLTARSMVTTAIKQIPQLSSFGVDVIDMTGTYDQRSLFSEKSLRMVCIAADWFRAQLRRSHWVRKSLDHNLSSYTMKTGIEGACGRYVSNGSVIAAACGLGLQVTTQPLNPNPRIILKVEAESLA